VRVAFGALERFAAWPTPEQYNELALQVPRTRGVELPRFVPENREAVRRVGDWLVALHRGLPKSSVGGDRDPAAQLTFEAEFLARSGRFFGHFAGESC